MKYCNASTSTSGNTSPASDSAVKPSSLGNRSGGDSSGEDDPENDGSVKTDKRKLKDSITPEKVEPSKKVDTKTTPAKK